MARIAKMTNDELQGKTMSEIKAIIHEDIANLETFDKNSLQSFLYALLGGITTATNSYRGEGDWKIEETLWQGFGEAKVEFHADVPSNNMHVGDGFVTSYYVEGGKRGIVAIFPNLYMGEENAVTVFWLLELDR